MDLVVSCSANNLISVGYQNLLKVSKKRDEPSTVRQQNRQAQHYANAQLEIVQGMSGGCLLNYYGLESAKVLHKGEVEKWKEARERSLDIIHEVQAKNIKDKFTKKHEKPIRPRAGFGRISDRHTRFTKLARSRILCGGSIISSESIEPAYSTFLTLTVPGDTRGCRDNVARWSAYLANRVLQGVRDAKRSFKGKVEYFYSWEFQKRGMLHLHLVIYADAAGISYSMAQAVSQRWFGALKSLAADGIELFTKSNGRECWLPEFWQADIQPVRKSIAAYVSKYVCKGTQQPKSVGGSLGNSPPPPPRWWGMSRNLLSAIKRHSSKLVLSGLSEDDCARLAEMICKKLSQSGAVVQMNSYSFEVNYGGYHVGSGFRFLYYLEHRFYGFVRSLLGHCLAADCSHIHYGYGVTGENWLYKQFVGKECEVPRFADLVELAT